MQLTPSQQSPTSQSSTGAGSATAELSSDAKQLGSTAANRLHSEVDARKSTAVSQAQSVSSAIERAADGLDESAPAWLKSAFQQGAQKLQQFADTIEQKDSRELMRDAQDFARNNPGTFLAACAAAGFAAARVLKAGGEQQGSQGFPDQAFGETETWGSGEQSFGQSYGETQTLGQSAREDNPMFQDAGEDPATRNRGEFV